MLHVKHVSSKMIGMNFKCVCDYGYYDIRTVKLCYRKENNFLNVFLRVQLKLWKVCRK